MIDRMTIIGRHYDVILVNLLAGLKFQFFPRAKNTNKNSKVCDEIRRLAKAFWIFNVRIGIPMRSFIMKKEPEPSAILNPPFWIN